MDRVLRRVRTMQSLADQMGVDISTVSRWRSRGRIPVGRVLTLERLTGIPRHELRPDIYPPEDHHAR